MTTSNRQDVTQAFLQSLASDTPPRLRFLLERVVHHLHALASETRLTHAEWRCGIELLTRAGRITDDKRNEFVLFSDVLGLSSLLDVLHSQAGGTPSSVLGPFHIRGAPPLAFGGDLKGDNAGATVFVSGAVRDTAGQPLAGAAIEFWQTASNGLYSNQDPARGEWNLRARLRTDAQGRYAFTTVRPAPYLVPSDGPVGEMLAATGRHPWRPSHYHFIVEAAGHRTLVTELFPADDRYLHEDAVFGVRDGLVYDTRRFDDAAQAPAGFQLSAAPGTPFEQVRFDFTLLAEPLQTVEPPAAAEPQPLCLLAAMMEPPAALDAEFNDWYDTEHIPERRPIDGFLTLQRFRCTEGSPRYLALYDLAGPGVITGPAYAAISGANTSPWSLRLAPSLQDRQRFEACQVLPGGALLDGCGRAETLVLWHWQGIDVAAEPALFAALTESYRSDPAFAQARLFRSESPAGVEHLGLVEFTAPPGRADGAATPVIQPDQLVRVNHYRRYVRGCA